MAAEARHRVHHASTRNACIRMSSTLTTAPERITNPRASTVQVIVRHLSRPPMLSKTISVA
jgi:hypothetical protein